MGIAVGIKKKQTNNHRYQQEENPFHEMRPMTENKKYSNGVLEEHTLIKGAIVSHLFRVRV